MAERQQDDLAHFEEAAVEVARLAGAILLDSLGRVERIEFKGRVDLVTEVDKRSEAAIVGFLNARFPDHRIVAEEGSGEAEGDSPYRWLIDPLDGTTNYAHANPYFGVSLALQHQDQAVVAVVYDPVRDELFSAVRGGGAYLNNRPIHVSTIEQVLYSLISTGFPYRPEQRPCALAHWATFTNAAQAVRRNGAAALDLCYVAAGRFDGFYERELGPWDCAAGALVVAEAGGCVTDYQGAPFDPFSGAVLATNGRLHDEMLALLALSEGNGR